MRRTILQITECMMKIKTIAVKVCRTVAVHAQLKAKLLIEHGYTQLTHLH